MKYMLLMMANQKGWEEIGTWPPEDVKAHIDFMGEVGRDLGEAGELVDSQGLGGPPQARIVRARPGAEPVVTDGPFPEAKEFLAGYWVVEVANPERAIEIAARISAAPGPGGTPINMPVEVHPILEAPSEI